MYLFFCKAPITLTHITDLNKIFSGPFNAVSNCASWQMVGYCEWCIRIDVERSSRDILECAVTTFGWMDRVKPRTNVSQVSQSTGQDLHQECSEYEERVLSTRSWHLVVMGSLYYSFKKHSSNFLATHCSVSSHHVCAIRIAFIFPEKRVCTWNGKYANTLFSVFLTEAVLGIQVSQHPLSYSGQFISVSPTVLHHQNSAALGTHKYGSVRSSSC
jgi:hypothetical protein